MQINKLSRHFVLEHPRETARILENYEVGEVVAFITSLEDENAATVMRYMSPDLTFNCLNTTTVEHAARLLECLEVDVSARFLGRMTSQARMSILNRMRKTTSHRLRQVLRYPSGTIGQYMSPDVFIAGEEMTVHEVINSARNSKSELLSDIFIVDDNHFLSGMVDLKNLMLADPDTRIIKIMNVPDTVLNVRTNLDYVKDNPRWQFKEVLPVTDHKNVFVGVLKRSTLFETLTSKYFQKKNETPLIETVVEVADLFWDICSSIIFPKIDIKPKGRGND